MRQVRKGDMAIIAPWAKGNCDGKKIGGCVPNHRRSIFIILTNPQAPWDTKSWPNFTGKIVLIEAPCKCQGWMDASKLIPIDKGDPDAQTTRSSEKERTA